MGKGLKRAFDEGICTREELWITSKLWNADHGNVKGAIDKTLKVGAGHDPWSRVHCSGLFGCSSVLKWRDLARINALLVITAAC